jgi:hypothetical protein
MILIEISNQWVAYVRANRHLLTLVCNTDMFNDIPDSKPSLSLHEISVILQSHITPSFAAIAVEHIPSGSHAVYKVTDSSSACYILKLGARKWPHKIETEVATIAYLREHTHIPVPVVRGYRVDNWETDYILMDFVEGQKLRIIWMDLSQAEQISYTLQIASLYAELDRTSFAPIGSLRLDGRVGPFDSLDTITGPDGRLIGTSLGPYESLKAFWHGYLHYTIDQLATDELLKANAHFCEELYRWADDWSQKAPESDSYCLFSLECLKMDDMIVRDGKIIAVVDLENYQTNVPEFLRLYSPSRLSQEMDEIFTKECEKLGVRAWVETDEASKKRYDYCSDTILIMQQIVPGDHNSYIRNKDYDGLERRLKVAHDVLLSTLNTFRNSPKPK